jgi:putative tricarboxylic transport membrane protein
MVPMLMLGIPGSEATAILLGGFILWGLQPGPLFMSQQPTFAWTLIGSMLMGNLMLVCLSLFAIRFFAEFTRIPYGIVIPVVVALCVVGSYSVEGQLSDVIVMLIAGFVGYYMKRYGFSPGACVIGLVLGPQAEATLRQALAVSNGNLSIFWDRVPSRIILISLVVALALLSVWRVHRRRHGAASGGGLVDQIADEIGRDLEPR